MFLLFCTSAFALNARERGVLEGGERISFGEIVGLFWLSFCFEEVGAWGLRCSMLAWKADIKDWRGGLIWR